MATYKGTTAVDTFSGADGVADLFKFNSATLSGTDTASGGAGPVDDVFRVTAVGNITAAMLAGVSGMEQIQLAGGGSSFELTYDMLATARHTKVTVIGSATNDTVFGSLASDASMKIIFNAGDGDNNYYGGNAKENLIGGDGIDTFYGGGSKDKLSGGNGTDTLDGGGGNDKVSGGSGTDYLDGGSGNDRVYGGTGDGYLYGGGGKDKIFADSGSPFLYGLAGQDTMTIWSGDTGLTDGIVYWNESDGGVAGLGDIVRGDLGFVAESDIHFWFDQSTGQFDTNGAFDEEVFDDGTSASGGGGSTDGVDAVFYDGNTTGLQLGSAAAVDQYFFDRYYEADDVGAFLAEKNADGSVTVYYDADAFSFGGVVTLAHVEDYTGSILGLSGYFDVF